MPIYEYRCENRHEFEVMQRMSEAPVETCQVCGAPVQRVFHAPAVHFKGSGFYNTDYGTRKRAREKSSENGGSSSETNGKTSDSSSTSTKSESSTSGSSSSSTSSKSSD
jgi:putative FmdB family regulatory protein